MSIKKGKRLLDEVKDIMRLRRGSRVRTADMVTHYSITNCFLTIEIRRTQRR